MDTSNKSMSNLCHAIYDIDDLDKHYKKILYQVKHNTRDINDVKRNIQPRFHQDYLFSIHENV